MHAECVYSYTRPIIRDIYSISFQLCSLYDMSDELFIGLRAATFLFLAEGRLNTSIVGLRIDLAAICSVIWHSNGNSGHDKIPMQVKMI